MAKITITIEDFQKGEIAVHFDANPIPDEDVEKWTTAQAVAHHCLEAINEVSTSFYEIQKDKSTML